MLWRSGKDGVNSGRANDFSVVNEESRKTHEFILAYQGGVPHR